MTEFWLTEDQFAKIAPHLPDTSKNRVIAGFGRRFDVARSFDVIGLAFW